MATYSEAHQLMRQLKPIIDKLIEQQPNVRSAIKAKKAVVQAAPDTQRHTVAIKFLPDLFNRDIQPMTFPYNPCLSASDLEVGKAVFVFYFQSLSNGVVMQNDTWTAGGIGPGEGTVISVNGQTGEVTLDADDIKAVSLEPQTVTEEQQAQARENIGAGQTTFIVKEGESEEGRSIGEIIFEVIKKADDSTKSVLRIARASPTEKNQPLFRLSIVKKDKATSTQNYTLKIE